MKELGNKVVYELYPSSFYDSNNDGIGDINGIIEKLDYLEELGIDLIWITPIFKSPKNDNGYDISNYLEIDPSFGTMEDVEKLIDKAKKKNIGIMFDMVFNHVSSNHDWFKNAKNGNKKYLDYFYIINSKNKDLPNNWVSKFGGTAWEYQKEFDGFYLHLFDKTQVDLNWNNPDVRKEIHNIVNFWMKKGILGFRFDVINLIGKPSEFISTNDFGKSLYTDNPKVHKYLKELNKETFGKNENIITVGEMSSTTINNCIKYSNPNEKELDMTFNFHHLKVDYENGEKWKNKPWDINEFKNIIIKWQKEIYKNNGWNAVFLNNHDQPRVNTRYGDTDKYWFETSTMFATLIFTLKGTPFIYQGEEIGMTNPNFKTIEDYKDVESINIYKELKNNNLNEDEILDILKVKSRDNSRTPMQWSSDENAGFSKNKPWIKVNENYKKINVKDQLSNKNSIFNFYKKLINLKKTNLALIKGDIEFIDSNDSIFEYKRTYNDETLKILLNLSNKEIDKDMVEWINEKEIIISNIKNINNNKLLPFQALVVKG